MSIFDHGAALVPDVITEAEEERILLRISQAPWLTELSRRVQHYGFRYNYRGRAKTAKRASWSRAGRSRARRNRARRPVRRTGRAPLCSGWRYERYWTCVYHRWGRRTGRRSRGLATKSLKRSVVGGVGCDHGKSERRGSCRWWRAKRDTWHGAKKGPIPRRSEGPALSGRGGAAVMRRRS